MKASFSVPASISKKVTVFASFTACLVALLLFTSSQVSAGAVGAPDLIDASDSAGQSITDNITNLTSLTFQGSCVDGDQVNLLIENTSVNSTTCAGGTYNLTAGSVSEGSHSAMAYSFDGSGTFSEALNFTVDTTSPQCYLNTYNVTTLSPAIDGWSDSDVYKASIKIEGNNYLIDSPGDNWDIPAGTISPDLAYNNSYPLDVSCSDVAGNSTSTTQYIQVVRPIDVALNISLLTSGFIKSGQATTYSFTISNLDDTQKLNLKGVAVYTLIPPIFDLSALNQGDQIPTNNPNVECIYYGDASVAGEAFSQYAGNNVMLCQPNISSLDPGQSISFNIDLTPTANLPDGTSVRSLLYVDNYAEVHRDTIENSAENGEDFFALAINNVSRAIYKIQTNDPTPTSASNPTASSTSSESPNNLPSESRLASTGSNTWTLISLSAFAVLGSAVALKLRKSA
jgi:hypothetical protein